MSSIDFSELIISKKGVISSDNQPCGNIIGEKENIIIVEQGRSRLYHITKDKIKGYDGAQLQLNFPFSDLNNYEERAEKTDDAIDKATDMVSGGINKASDTVTDTIDKVKDVFRGKDNNNAS